jgi:Tfp pilus assembly protein PilW
MVAMVAGLIVMGATLAFTVTTLRSNADNIRSTRLTQDLRTGMNLVARELRRSGYDSQAADRTSRALSTAVSAPNTAYPISRHTSVTISGECILFAYNRPAGASQFKGFRRNATSGTLQHVVAATAPSCTGNTGWVDVSDSSVVNITGFLITPQPITFNQVVRSTVDAAGATTTTTASVTVRNYQLQVSGNLRFDPAIARTLTDQVRVRGDDVTLVTTVVP